MRHDTHDLLLVSVGDVRVLLVPTLSDAQPVVDDLPERSRSLGPLLALLPPVVNGVSRLLQSRQLFHVRRLAGILALVGVQPVLGGLQTGEELLLLLGLDERGVSSVELATGVVDVLFERVLSLLGLHDELVGRGHLAFLLHELVLGLGSEPAVSSDEVQGTGPLDLADLAGLFLLLVTLAGGVLFLLLDLFDGVGLFKAEDSVQVETGLDLDAGEVTGSGLLDALDGDLADPRVGTGGDTRVLGVPSLELEGASTVEGQDLGRRDGVLSGEDQELGILVRVTLLLLPTDLDGVRVDVVDGKLSDTEDGRQGGTGESGSSADGLFGVQGGREDLAGAKELQETFLDGGDSGGSTDQLDGVDLLQGETGLVDGLFEGDGDPVQEVRGELFESLPGHARRGVDVVHDALDVEDTLRVGTEDLLEPLTRGRETEDGLGVAHDVDLVLGLELFGEMLDQRIVEITSTKVRVVSGSLDGELTLAEPDDRGRVVRVADVDKDDVSSVLDALGEVGLGDPVSEGDGGGVVDQSETVETGNVGSVEDGTSLDVGVPTGHGDDNVGNGSLELGSGRVPQLAQVRSDQLGSVKSRRLAQVLDLDTDGTVNVDQLGVDELLLVLVDLGVGERSADESFEGSDGVLEVGGLGGLGGLSDQTLPRGERDEGAVGCVAREMISTGPRRDV